MIAFDVYLNDQKLCRAGIGDSGVLSAIVTWAAATLSTGIKDNSQFLTVGGLITPERNHVTWINQRSLVPGDKIQVIIVEADSVDEHLRREPEEDAKLRKAREEQVRRSAKELGWKLEEAEKSSGGSPTKS